MLLGDGQRNILGGRAVILVRLYLTMRFRTLRPPIWWNM